VDPRGGLYIFGEEKNPLHLPEIKPWTIQAIVQTVHQLCYPGKMKLYKISQQGLFNVCKS
jgi:hypothetical protein